MAGPQVCYVSRYLRLTACTPALCFISPHLWSHGEFPQTRQLRKENSGEALYTGFNWNELDVFQQPFRVVALKDSGRREILPGCRQPVHWVVTWEERKLVAYSLPGYLEIWKEQGQSIDDKEVWGKRMWVTTWKGHRVWVYWISLWIFMRGTLLRRPEKLVCKKTSVDVSWRFPATPVLV